MTAIKRPVSASKTGNYVVDADGLFVSPDTIAAEINKYKGPADAGELRKPGLEPRGCPTPGACYCPDQSAQIEAMRCDMEKWKRACLSETAEWQRVCDQRDKTIDAMRKALEQIVDTNSDMGGGRTFLYTREEMAQIARAALATD